LLDYLSAVTSRRSKLGASDQGELETGCDVTRLKYKRIIAVIKSAIVCGLAMTPKKLRHFGTDLTRIV